MGEGIKGRGFCLNLGSLDFGLLVPLILCLSEVPRDFEAEHKRDKISALLAWFGYGYDGYGYGYGYGCGSGGGGGCR